MASADPGEGLGGQFTCRPGGAVCPDVRSMFLWLFLDEAACDVSGNQSSTWPPPPPKGGPRPIRGRPGRCWGWEGPQGRLAQPPASDPLWTSPLEHGTSPPSVSTATLRALSVSFSPLSHGLLGNLSSPRRPSAGPAGHPAPRVPLTSQGARPCIQGPRGLSLGLRGCALVSGCAGRERAGAPNIFTKTPSQEL